MVTASDGSGDLLVVSSEIRSAHRSTSSNIQPWYYWHTRTGRLTSIAYETKRGIWAPRTSSSPFAHSFAATAATAPAAHFRPGHGNGRRRREWRYRRGGPSDVCVVVGGARVTRVQALEPGGDKEATCALPEGSHVQEEDVEAEDGGKMVAKDPGMYGDPPARVADQVGPSRSASTNKSTSFTDQIRCLCNAPSVMIVGRFVLSLVLRYTRLCVSLLENGTLSTAALSRRL